MAAAEYNLSVLAGGDIYEWASAAAADDTEAALRRLRSTHPFFFEGEPLYAKVPIPGPVARQRPLSRHSGKRGRRVSA